MMAETEKPPKEVGLVCRSCGCRHFLVYSTRQRRGYIQRVRICRYCGLRKVTNERPAGEK